MEEAVCVWQRGEQELYEKSLHLPLDFAENLKLLLKKKKTK